MRLDHQRCPRTRRISMTTNPKKRMSEPTFSKMKGLACLVMRRDGSFLLLRRAISEPLIHSEALSSERTKKSSRDDKTKRGVPHTAAAPHHRDPLSGEYVTIIGRCTVPLALSLSRRHLVSSLCVMSCPPHSTSSQLSLNVVLSSPPSRYKNR